jgi:hypothetical protein
VETGGDLKITILWNKQVRRDGTIPNNKADVLIRNKNGTCLLINVATPTDRNVIKKEAEKILKYKDLLIEIQIMRKMKTEIIPINIRATGTVSKSLEKYLANIPGEHDVRELQKTATLGSSYIIRKTLS